MIEVLLFYIVGSVGGKCLLGRYMAESSKERSDPTLDLGWCGFNDIVCRDIQPVVVSYLHFRQMGINLCLRSIDKGVLLSGSWRYGTRLERETIIGRNERVGADGIDLVTMSVPPLYQLGLSVGRAPFGLVWFTAKSTQVSPLAWFGSWTNCVGVIRSTDTLTGTSFGECENTSLVDPEWTISVANGSRLLPTE